MTKNRHAASNLLVCAGSLMTLSGILMALGGRLPIGGVFWAAAACMFLSARNFRLAEDKEITEESHHE